jgi:hypothetical protein
MDDLNDPRISAYRAQRRIRLPAPPGYRRKPSGAQQKQKALARARADARATRWHLVGFTDAAMIVIGLVIAAMVVLVLVLMMHR